MTTEEIFDGKTFNELYVEYYVKLCRHANRFLNNKHESQEVVQNSFLDLHKKPSAVQKSAIGWLMATVRNKAYTHIRTQVRRKVREQIFYDLGDTFSPFFNGPDYINGLINKVNCVIKDLPEEEQEVITYFLNGRNQSETAQDIGMNQATVSRRFKRAIKHIRERVSKADLKGERC